MALSTAPESQGEEKAVKAATAQFYAALNTMFTGPGRFVRRDRVDSMNGITPHFIQLKRAVFDLARTETT